MKLVKESLNFERAGNVKKSLGLGYEGKIRKFFDNLGYSEKYYTINVNNRIIFNGYLTIVEPIKDELPNRLTVKGTLSLNGSEITKLPENLIVFGNLILFNTNITELPKNLIVKGFIYVSEKQIELLNFIENNKFKKHLKII